MTLPVGIACSSSSAASGAAGANSCSANSSSGDIEITTDTTNNYSFWSQITLANWSVAEKSNLTFKWSAVTQDMFRQTMDPKADIGAIVPSIWRYTKAELEAKINNDELITSDRAGAAFLFTQSLLDEATRDDLTSDGTRVLAPDIKDAYFSTANYPASDSTYLVMLQQDGKTPGKQPRMMTTFGLNADSNSPATVAFDNTSTDLQFEADLLKLTPTQFPAGTNQITFDWTRMTTNAMNRSVDPFEITRVLVASFSLATSELQKNENFLNLEKLAVGLWESNPDDILGPKLSLSKLANSRGEAFTGIDASHTWILALENGNSLNPAPWYLTVLQPCPLSK